MTAYLVNSASGERIPLAGPILDRIQKEGGEARFLELLLNNIPPGKYLVHLHAEAAGTKYISYAKANLTIKQTFLPSRRKEMRIKDKTVVKQSGSKLFFRHAPPGDLCVMSRFDAGFLLEVKCDEK